MAENTIFDDVFRTMIEKMPELAIPLINEVFGTEYLHDAEIRQGRNEHTNPDRKKITDSYIMIEEYLEKKLLEKGKEKTFRDIRELIRRIVDYIFSKSEEIKKGMDEIMGGQVLELESDRLIKKGKVELLLEFLSNLGEIPDEIQKKIQGEQDQNVILSYLQKAAKAKTMEEFIEQIS